MAEEADELLEATGLGAGGAVLQLRLRGRDPRGGAAGEGVEGSDGHLDVVLAGVLDLVVGDAAEALDEEHDGGDAGPADLGGVVERAAGEAVGGAAAGLAHGGVAQLDQLGAEGEGLDVPDPPPGDVDPIVGGDALAGVAGLLQHAGGLVKRTYLVARPG